MLDIGGDERARASQLEALLNNQLWPDFRHLISRGGHHASKAEYENSLRRNR